jgi:hypothetical protein
VNSVTDPAGAGAAIAEPIPTVEDNTADAHRTRQPIPRSNDNTCPPDERNNNPNQPRPNFTRPAPQADRNGVKLN